MATPQQVAHLLRRTGFGIRPNEINSLAGEDIHDLIDQRIDDDGWSVSADDANARTFEDAEWDLLPREWMTRIMSPEAGLHERMVWFWHAHFTTNRSETTNELMWRQPVCIGTVDYWQGLTAQCKRSLSLSKPSLTYMRMVDRF